MKRRLWFFMLALIVTLVGCNAGRDERPVFFEADIVSHQPADGDIAYDPVEGTYTVAEGPERILFGIDESDSHHPEYRAFLDFPLDGSTGQDIVPLHAEIVSATLEVFVDSVSFAHVVPTLLDLVNYSALELRREDYYSPPLRSMALDFFASDYGRYVSIDVTSLMRSAQRFGLRDFQVRFLVDPEADWGLVGIEDLLTVAITAPLLNIVYTH